MSEVAARHEADVSLDSIQVAFFLSDGTTARAEYPENPDPCAAVEALIMDKKRSGSGIAVDSLDSEQARAPRDSLRRITSSLGLCVDLAGGKFGSVAASILRAGWPSCG